MKPPKGYEECVSCNPCNPDCDGTGRPYTCYWCFGTGFMLTGDSQSDLAYTERGLEPRNTPLRNILPSGYIPD